MYWHCYFQCLCNNFNLCTRIFLILSFSVPWWKLPSLYWHISHTVIFSALVKAYWHISHTVIFSALVKASIFVLTYFSYCYFQCLGESLHLCTDIFLMLLFSVPWWKPPSLYSHISHTVIFSALVKASIFVLAYFSYCYFQCIGESFHLCTDIFLILLFSVPWWKLPSLYWHISHTVIFSAMVKASIFVLKYFSYCYFQCIGESFHLCTQVFLMLLFSVPWWKLPSLYSSISHTVIFSALVKASIFVLAYFSYCYFQCIGESFHLCTDIFLILLFSVRWWKPPSLYSSISHTVIFSALVKASIFVLKYFSYCYCQCLGESLHLCTQVFLILLFSVPWWKLPSLYWHISHTVIFSALVKASIFILTYFSYCYFQCLGESFHLCTDIFLILLFSVPWWKLPSLYWHISHTVIFSALVKASIFVLAYFSYCYFQCLGESFHLCTDIFLILLFSVRWWKPPSLYSSISHTVIFSALVKASIFVLTYFSYCYFQCLGESFHLCTQVFLILLFSVPWWKPPSLYCSALVKASIFVLHISHTVIFSALVKAYWHVIFFVLTYFSYCYFQCLGESFHLCTQVFLILLFSVPWWKPPSLYWKLFSVPWWKPSLYSSISHTVIFSALVKASIFVLTYFSYCYFQCLGESLHLCTHIFLILLFSVPWWKLPSLYWHISHTVIFSALVKASIFVLTYFSYCYFQCLGESLHLCTQVFLMLLSVPWWKPPSLYSSISHTVIFSALVKASIFVLTYFSYCYFQCVGESFHLCTRIFLILLFSVPWWKLPSLYWHISHTVIFSALVKASIFVLTYFSYCYFQCLGESLHLCTQVFLILLFSVPWWKPPSLYSSISHTVIFSALVKASIFVLTYFSYCYFQCLGESLHLCTEYFSYCYFQCLGESLHLCTDIFLILRWWKPPSLYSSISHTVVLGESIFVLISHTVIFSALVKASIFVLTYFSYCYFQCLGESLHLCTDIFLTLLFSVPWWKLPSLYWHISHTVIFSALVKASIFVLTYFSYCYFQCLGESLHLCTQVFLILLFSVPWWKLPSLIEKWMLEEQQPQHSKKTWDVR